MLDTTHSLGFRARLSRFIDVDWTWFTEPMVGIQAGPEAYLYSPGVCSVSKSIGPDTLNLPNLVPAEFAECYVRQCTQALAETN